MKPKPNLENKKELAEKIRKTRIHVAEMTQKEFADSLGVTRTYIAQLENPNSIKYPSPTLLRKIADNYHIDYQYLTCSTPNSFSRMDEEEQLLEKIQLQELFQTPHSRQETSLTLIAQTFYRLMDKELKQNLYPKNLKQTEQEQYLSIFSAFYKPIIETLMEVKNNLHHRAPDHDVYERYLLKIQEEIEHLKQTEEDREE